MILPAERKTSVISPVFTENLTLLKRDLDRVGSYGPTGNRLVSASITQYQLSLFTSFFRRFPELHYSQGMPEMSIVIMSLFHPELVDTAAMLSEPHSIIIQETELMLLQYFLLDLMGPHVSQSAEIARTEVDLFHLLLRHEDPELSEHLVTHDIIPTFFPMPWLHSFFRLLTYHDVCFLFYLHCYSLFYCFSR